MYGFLPGVEDIQAEPPHGVDPHLVFFFDSGNLERSGNAVRRIASHATIVNIGHHPSNSRFGDINVIEPGASAVGQMVLEMLDHFGYAITPTIAINLYVALLTDTGGFRHENTTPRALEDAARLARLGADPGHIATQVYKMRPETTLKLNGLALATMRVELDGRLAWAKVTRRLAGFLGRGVAVVWLVDPEGRSVTVHRLNQLPQVYEGDDELTGEPELPGFRCRVAEMFYLPGEEAAVNQAKPG